jgi:peptidoglycan-associated lipoprotein
MQKKWCVILALVFIVPGLLFTVSCAKKTVKKAPAMTQSTEDDAARAAAAEKARQEELAKQRALEEERLQEEARRMREAKESFLNEDIPFEFDSATLTAEAQEILRQKAEWLQNNPQVAATIEGHCDERGTNAYNLALGERRAESAKTFLKNLGIASSRLTTISYGEERPVDPGHNEEAWSKNRRGHFIIN